MNQQDFALDNIRNLKCRKINQTDLIIISFPVIMSI